MLSVAVTVKLYAPGNVGVPVRPPPAASDKPVGRLPAVTAYVYGDAPPLATIVWLYATFCVPFGNGVPGLMVIAGHEPMTTVSCLLPEQPNVSVAVTVNSYVPFVVGVPWSKPPVVSVKPGGTGPVAENVNVELLPLAPYWYEGYAMPVNAFGAAPVTVIVGQLIFTVSTCAPVQL